MGAHTMRITGIDADTKSIAMVTFLGKPLSAEYIKVPGQRANDRFNNLIRAFIELQSEWLLSDWVWIEEPVMGANAKASINQAYVVGAIRAVLIQHGIPNTVINNATWKKQVIGNGHASKEEIADFATGALDMKSGQQQDIYDAACMAQFGLRATQ